jgi:guanylate kinase
MMSDFLSSDEMARFEELLKTYRPNDEVSDAFKRSNFAVIAGPAAAGKDTLRSLLLALPQTPYVSIVSTTSRSPRTGEFNGQEYNFASAADMEQDLTKGMYFEAALVHGQQLSALHVDEIHNLGSSKIGLSILVIKIEQQLRKQKTDIRTIFLIPPSFEVMMERLRMGRNFTEEELQRRLVAAEEELHYGLTDQNYYCIVSDGKTKVRDLADTFLRTGVKDVQTDQAARLVARQLASDLETHLAAVV